MRLLLLGHKTTEQQGRLEALLNAQGHEFSSRIFSEVQEGHETSAYDVVLVQLSPSSELLYLSELCRRLRSFACCAQSRILALSEQPLSEAELRTLLNAGVQDYLASPLGAEQLQQRLLILERQAQESAQLRRKIQYLTRKQQRRQRTEKALRARMEDALKKGWDYLEILNDSLEDAIITLTMPERIIEYCNRAVEKILGYTLEECEGESFGFFFPDHRGERDFIQRLNEAIHKKQSSLHTENLLQRASGERFTAEITTTFMYEQDRLTRTVSSIRDITERKEMEKALEEERALLAMKVEERTGELQQANKELARASQHKDRFLANMSHELRTPINAILGYAKILQKGGGLTQLQQDGLQTIQESGEHLLHLITDILDLSKIEAGRLELHLSEIYLPEFLNHVANMIRVRAEEKSIRFSFEHDPDLPQGIRSDEKRLREILINLLDNAVKFTNQGEVWLRITPQERNERYVCLLFEVEDSGPGIPPEHLHEIFLPFQQVEQFSYSTEGTGLGLAICRQLVRLMGGELEVRSIVDVGSTFSFVLEAPVVQDFVPIPRRLQTEIIGYKGAARRVMLVDDKAENRVILYNVLQPLGFELSEAEGGFDCLKKLDETIELLLLDLRMPDLDGFETARRIRALPGGTRFKIVAISASVFQKTRQKSLDAGCDAFLSKPIDERELLRVLQTQLKLEWKFQPSQPVEADKRSADEIQFPSLKSDDIEELRTFARYGNITRILQILELLETRGSKYQPLVETLRNYSSNFRMKEILETINALEIDDDAR